VIAGAMNGPTFLTYVERCLAPTLHRGDIVIIDNLPAHKVADVIDGIEAVGDYLPRIHRISTRSNSSSANLRRCCERTIARLLRKIRLLLRAVSADECLNFLRHAGYAST
jgi:hypothetical protein